MVTILHLDPFMIDIDAYFQLPFCKVAPKKRDDYLLWFPINNGWGEPSIPTSSLSTPPSSTFTKSSPAGRRDTKGTAAVSSDFNGEGCDEIAENGDLPTKIISNLFPICQKKTLCSLDFSRFFLVKCWIFLGTFREIFIHLIALILFLMLRSLLPS